MSVEQFFTLDRPLHPLPEQGRMRSANLWGLDRLVERLGGDTRAILEDHGLDSGVIRTGDAFVDCQTLVELYESCAASFNQPLFGIHLANMQTPDVYGAVTALCRAAPDLRTAINCLIEYIPVVHSSESVLELVEGVDIAEFRWSEHSDMGINEQANYQGLLLNLKVLRMLGGTGFTPSHVGLPRAMFRNTVPDLEQAIHCKVRISGGKGYIAFPAASLETPVISANQPLFRLLHGYMLRLKNRPSPDLVERVETFIDSRLGRGDISVAHCAENLKVSVRTLQMRLRDGKTSYSELLDRRRLCRAGELLKQTGLSIAEIADALGYAERTSFGRAFKRWCGHSPQAYRRHH